MYKATYTVIQATTHEVATEVDLNGAKVVANVPSLVVQLAPQDNPSENSVIKLVVPGVSELAPFVSGAQISVTFKEV